MENISQNLDDINKRGIQYASMTRTELLIALGEIKSIHKKFKSKVEEFEYYMQMIECELLIYTSYCKENKYKYALSYAQLADNLMRENHKFFDKVNNKHLVSMIRILQLINFKKSLLTIIPTLNILVKIL